MMSGISYPHQAVHYWTPDEWARTLAIQAFGLALSNTARVTRMPACELRRVRILAS